MSQKPVILLFHLGESSFVKEDIKIFNSIGILRTYHFQPSNSFPKLLLGFIHQFFWLASNIKDADILYCWFSDYHGFLPALFSKITKKPLLTVLGGFDCIKMPHLDYGIFCSPWRKHFGKFVVNNTKLLLPVNDSLIETYPIAKNWPDAYPNGLKHNLKNFKTDFIDLPTGYDSSVWNSGEQKRDKIVSTVAACSTLQIAKRKGLDLFIKTAKNLPEFQFKIVGVSADLEKILRQKYSPTQNVLFLPRQPREELNKVYTESSVYLQLSRAEGLPNVLCEAMMCGCVPVGSPVFGIPHGIGDTGYVAEDPDPKKIADLVQLAHQNADQLRMKARQRVVENFSIQKREETLQAVLKKYGVLN